MKKIVMILFGVFCCCCSKMEKNKKKNPSEIKELITHLNLYYDEFDAFPNTDDYKTPVTKLSLVIKDYSIGDTLHKVYVLDNMSSIDTFKIVSNNRYINSIKLSVQDSFNLDISQKAIKVYKSVYVSGRDGQRILNNVFYNDSLGIILKRSVFQRSGIGEYGPHFLIQQIKSNPEFFKWSGR